MGVPPPRVTSILYLHSFFFYSPGWRFVMQTEILGNITHFLIFVFFLYFFHYSSCHKDHFTFLNSQPAGGGSTPYDGLYGKVPPERGTFFRLEIFERVGKSVIWASSVTWPIKKDFTKDFYGCEKVEKIFCWSGLYRSYVLRHLRLRSFNSPLWLMLVLYEFLGRRSFMDPICCNFCMVLPMFFRLVLPILYFLCETSTWHLDSCPPEDTWYGVILRVLRVLGQSLKSECADIFH